MLFTAADILKLEPVKVFEEQLLVNSIVVESVEKATGIHLHQKEVQVKDNQKVKIITSGAKKMMIVLHKDSIQNDLKQRGFILQL